MFLKHIAFKKITPDAQKNIESVCIITRGLIRDLSPSLAVIEKNYPDTKVSILMNSEAYNQQEKVFSREYFQYSYKSFSGLFRLLVLLLKIRSSFSVVVVQYLSADVPLKDNLIVEIIAYFLNPRIFSILQKGELKSFRFKYSFLYWVVSSIRLMLSLVLTVILTTFVSLFIICMILLTEPFLMIKKYATK